MEIKKLPFNALVLLSDFLKKSEFEDLQISTNPTLTIKTDIARDKNNPRKKIIKRTTTYKRRQFESTNSLDSFFFDDRSSMNESIRSDAFTTRNTTQFKDDVSIFKQNFRNNLLESIVKIQRFWRLKKVKKFKAKVDPYSLTKRVIYKDIIEKVVRIQRQARKLLDRRFRVYIVKKILRNVMNDTATKPIVKTGSSGVNKKSVLKLKVFVKFNFRRKLKRISMILLHLLIY
jgi:hypothetical protein